jgi:hypothetical protein
LIIRHLITSWQQRGSSNSGLGGHTGHGPPISSQRCFLCGYEKACNPSHTHTHTISRMRLSHKLLVSLAIHSTSTYVVSETVTTDITSAVTCAGLRSVLGNTTVASMGAEYNATVTGAWNLLNTELRPACIVYPRNAGHVQIAMKAIFRDKVHYAVQAGTHSAMKGWNK